MAPSLLVTISSYGNKQKQNTVTLKRQTNLITDFNGWSFIQNIFALKKVCKVKVTPHTSQGGQHGRSLTRFLKHEATKSIASPPLDGILDHRRVTPNSMSPVHIHTPGWRETMWGKVPCLRKQHDGRDWDSNHRPSDLKLNALTTTPLRPHHVKKNVVVYLKAKQTNKTLH